MINMSQYGPVKSEMSLVSFKKAKITLYITEVYEGLGVLLSALSRYEEECHSAFWRHPCMAAR